MAIDFDAILQQIQGSQDTANAANLERYNQLLASIQTLGTQVGEEGTFGKALALQDQVGDAGRQRITEQAQKTWASAEQDLTTRGLGNTTIREAVRRGTASDAEMARQQLEGSLAQQKSGIYQGLAGAQLQVGGMQAGAIEGMTQQGPDLGMFAGLLQAAAAGDKADAAQMRTATITSPQTGGSEYFPTPAERAARSAARQASTQSAESHKAAMAQSAAQTRAIGQQGRGGGGGTPTGSGLNLATTPQRAGTAAGEGQMWGAGGPGSTPQWSTGEPSTPALAGAATEQQAFGGPEVEAEQMAMEAAGPVPGPAGTETGDDLDYGQIARDYVQKFGEGIKYGYGSGRDAAYRRAQQRLAGAGGGSGPNQASRRGGGGR